MSSADIPTFAVTSVRKSIDLGPATIDGFMLPDGSFRQGLRSTGRAVGVGHQQVSRTISLLPAAGVNPLQCNESHAFPQAKTASSTAVPAMIKLADRQEVLLSLSLAHRVWAYTARHDKDEAIRDQASALIEALAVVSLERSFQEAFGVVDSRSQAERVRDYWFRYAAGNYDSLFDNNFQILFKRVTGFDLNSKNSKVKFIISNFIYNRLPSDVVDKLYELNPADSEWRRQHKHQAWFTDDSTRTALLPIVAACKACMIGNTNTTDVNEQMDKLFPAQRGPRMSTSLKRYNQLNGIDCEDFANAGELFGKLCPPEDVGEYRQSALV